MMMNNKRKKNPCEFLKIFFYSSALRNNIFRIYTEIVFACFQKKHSLKNIRKQYYEQMFKLRIF